MKPSEDALKVARQFLETAVLRKRLRYAYTLVAPALKAGETRKEWESGNNPVRSFPARNASTARFTILNSRKTELFIGMQLIPRPKSSERPLQFHMQLRKQGSGNWLVGYFECICSSIPFPY